MSDPSGRQSSRVVLAVAVLSCSSAPMLTCSTILPEWQNGRGDPRCSFPNDLTSESLMQTAIAQRIEFTAEDFYSASNVELATSGVKRK